MFWNNSPYGNYRTRSFANVWPNAQQFLDDVQNNPLNQIEPLTESFITQTYYMLYARYGNSHIANSDENQFKFKVYSLLARYGPAVAKQQEIQTQLRNTSDDELAIGSKQVYNKAYNPSQITGTGIDDELQTLNEQTVAKAKRGVLEVKSLQQDLLIADVFGPFLRRFQDLFVVVAQPRCPLWYETKIDEDIIIGDTEEDGESS